MSIATEIVTFKVIESVVREEFIKTVNDLEKHFHALQPGFIDTELLYHDNGGEWIMIQHWEGLEQMKAASVKMFHNPLTELFVQSLDPKTVKMKMMLQLGSWNRETNGQ